MKKIVVLIILSLTVILSCDQQRPVEKVIENALSFSLNQYSLMYDMMKDKPDQLPRTIDSEGNLLTENSRGWTSGFFPGSLWYLYEYTQDTELKEKAQLITTRVENEKYTTNNHDVGFILYCSFGNGLRLAGNESYNEVLLTGAKSLSTRFRLNIGCIQ